MRARLCAGLAGWTENAYMNMRMKITAPPATKPVTGREKRLEQALLDMVYQAEQAGWMEAAGEKRVALLLAKNTLNER